MDRWRRAAAIVDEALAVDGPAREALIGAHCADDPSLETDVRRWLAATDAPSSLLTGPALPRDGLDGLSFATPATPRLAVDSRVGAWRIVRFLGSGGMGDVYEAARDDGAFDRRVALKVVRLHEGQERLARRFQRERALLAGLDHPGIARLLDGGTLADGTPFYAMELVDGLPIDRWCDERQLHLRDRVGLVLQICAAVSYAHDRLVVHRDLKPSNVLVTPDGIVKVVDFGIARALDDTPGNPTERLESDGISQAQWRALTPAYASPEQFIGRATTAATDVYSLTAILHRLLTGSPPTEPFAPFLGGATRQRSALSCSERVRADGARDQIAAARRTTAPELVRALRGDLDAIVACGLARDTRDRYRSIEALAGDLSNHLAARPLAARHEGWQSRAVKFVRRHRAGVLAGTLAIGGLLLTTTVALMQAARADRAARQAKAANTFLLDLLALPYPFDSGPTRQRSLRALLDSGRARALRLSAANESPGTEILLALSRGYNGLGDTRAAAQLARSALDERLRTLGLDAKEVAAARITLAEALGRDGRPLEAIPQYDSTLLVERARLGPRSVRVGVILQARARALRVAGDVAGSERTLAEVLSIFHDSAGPARNAYAHALQTMGHIHRERGHFTEAEASYRAALSVRRLLEGNAIEIANDEGDIAAALMDQGRLADAEPLILHSLETKRTRLGDLDPEVADDEVKLARLRLLGGQPRAADSLLRRALASYGATNGTPGWRQLDAIEALVATQLTLGDAEGAARTAQRGLDSLATTAMPRARAQSSLYRLLARAASTGGDPSGARRWLAACDSARATLLAAGGATAGCADGRIVAPIARPD